MSDGNKAPVNYDFATVCAEAIMREKTERMARKEQMMQSDLARVIREQDALRLDRPGVAIVCDYSPSVGPVGATPSIEEMIYAAYPRKVGKRKALAAIATAIKDINAKELLARVKAYKAATDLWPAQERQYIPHPSTWFNRGSYADDPKEWERGQPALQPRQDYSRI